MLFLENLKLALVAIRSNKMRSFLTMLGIIVGISSVISIETLGTAVRGVVGKEFESFGRNSAYIMPSYDPTHAEESRDSDMFRKEDVEALKARFPKELPYIVLPAVDQSEVSVGRMKGNFNMNGVAGFYNRYRPMDILYGRMPTDEDVRTQKRFIAIPEKAALDLFGRANVIGEHLTVMLSKSQTDVLIIGVYRPQKSLFAALRPGTSHEVYLPYTLWPVQDEGSFYIEVVLNPESRDLTATLKQVTEYVDLIKHRRTGFFEGQSTASQMDQIDNILNILSLAVGAIAAISLVVGGIGIMNIMLVSVTERTREIGIRKSLGAKTGDILFQFLVESIIISGIGGLIGTLLGVGIAALVPLVAGIDVDVNISLDPKVVLIAVVFSVGVGMFFGLYPARRAARLDPIEALRYE